jgi:hypothetical protein
VLDPGGLSMLQGVGFAIASVPNLHAKVSLVDSSWGMVGSGNLTGAGLGGEGGGNYEMGVLLTANQIEDATEIFAAWWSAATAVNADDLASYAALPKMANPSIGKVGSMFEVPQITSLVNILSEESAAASSRRYWINANYHDPNNEFWWRRGWVSDGKRKTYEVGDLLVIYLGKTNHGPQRCPAILRVESPCKEDSDFVLRERDLDAAEQWPFVTKTSVVAEAPPWAGVRLAVAGKTYLQVENGCQLTQDEFERIAWTFPG